MIEKSRCLLLLYFGLSVAWMNERPVLESRDGNLIIASAKDRNITLKIIGNGYVNINEINLLHVALAAQNATRLIERLRMGYLIEVENHIERLSNMIEGPTGLQRRIAILEGSTNNNATRWNRFRPNTITDSVVRSSIHRISDRLRRLDEKVASILFKLKENDCQSNPCQNGGSCQDLYEGYQCHCSSGWEGPNCITDVNECVRFMGTDLGCQNRATCFNLPGSYRCECPPGWFGLHCTKKTSICNTQNSEELCGHGVCVGKPGSPLGYTCICDQGWETDGTNPACTKDVNECEAKHPPCSMNPAVTCLNLPGAFICGACPHGYTGNGYYCIDIDECLDNNGGCSTSPRVQCINTMGSRVCGSCPSGYQGDGTFCSYVGACRINNGGCHPLASCIENPALTSSYVQCRCPTGYEGDGMGPNGCQRSAPSNNTCSSHSCVHGTCVMSYYGPVCRCDAGYKGSSCQIQIDPCSSNPCKNNGVCSSSNGGVVCDCPSSFTGRRCETPRQTCGGVSRNPVGNLEFPLGGSTYQHGLSCAWVLVTNHSLVLNVTFTAFNLEQSADCKFDFLQIHDGRNAGSHMIGRFCGHNLPNENGTIISSHNALYFWFHSDNTISHDGFAFHWNSISPVCGGTYEADYGTIISPGSPGRYPPNRDCYWQISMRPGKRIQFHFGQLMLEEHSTCEFDYVEITGRQSERLGLYCNHSHPAPLITPEDVAQVHFHSDASGQDVGFQIHYAIVEGTPDCGGVHTSFKGTISTNSKEEYEPNMNCDWKIQLLPNEKIKIVWVSFNLEESTDCHFDVVEVYDGPDTNSPLLGRFCGTDLPPTIKSNSNIVLVTFKSDWSYEAEGFTLTYEVMCGGEFHSEKGLIHSPMYPSPYRSSRTCVYEIIQPPGKGIVLTLVDMDIEGKWTSSCYHDYLEIFDGENENSTLLATLCGSSEYMPSEPYYSTYNYMYLRFTTDSTIEGRGFLANYTTIDRRCGGLFKSSSGVIQSPTENGYYRNDEECIWTIHAPPGYVIQLTWIAFNLEHHFNCDNDYVSIYENNTMEDSDKIGTFCGGTKPPMISTQGRTMTIVFRTDSSVTIEGFIANYVFIDASKVCGGYYFKQNGVLKSPNYPNSYPDNRECVWVIEGPPKRIITLKVNHFVLEEHSSCEFDYLEIRNGGYDSSPLIGKYCNTEIPTEFKSQTNQMYIKFVSDGSKSEDGFEIEWDSSLEGCGGSLTSASGDIISPNYPQPYFQNAECTWRIAVAFGNLIQLYVLDLDLEQHEKCRFDYLEISEGATRKQGAKRYCSKHPKIITSKTNMMTIRFRSDFTTAGRGFHIKYETLCHNKVHGFRGIIESPNFPNNYEHSTNCSWTIEAPIGNKVNLTFSHFDLEGSVRQNESCKFDYLEIKEGEYDTPNTELGKFCGSELPKKIHSSEHQVFLSFVTDSYIAFNGFRLEWSIHGCGGHLTKSFDRFTSPGFPTPYPFNVHCEWLIEVDYMHSIEITFHEVNTEKIQNCIFDKVILFNGEDEDAPKLAEFCHSDKPLIFTSSGNKIFVKFSSDTSYAGRGFNASYSTVAVKCGGKFSSNTGVISSANYPLNYPNNQYCEWHLQVDKNHLVNVTFEDFDIEDSGNCTDDYVKLYDGATKDDFLLGTHCRNQLPPSYVSSSNEMLIVMRTDSIISAKGFSARYLTACGARIVIKDQGYLVSSSNFLQTNAIVNCTWILVAEDPSDHVTLTFTHMDLSTPVIHRFLYSPLDSNTCAIQSVQVIEGEGMDGPVLGKWCDNKVPASITSTGSALTIHLTINIELVGHFAATYSVLNSACGGTYTSEHGTIASPGYPNSYPLNSECIWILNVSPGNRIRLSFTELDVQNSENCDLDYVEIREDDGIGKMIGTACGQKIPDVVESSKKLWIKFKSDEAGTGKGFTADYSVVAGNELEGPTGTISSPLYPLPFSGIGEFSWRLTVENGYIVRIMFQDVHMESRGSDCTSSLKIFDGYNDEASTLLKACDINTPEPVQSSSNVVYVVMSLEYNFIKNSNWFYLTWIQIPRITKNDQVEDEIKLSECNKEISLIHEGNSSYTFHSPGWPHGYKSNLNCNWVFTSPPGTHLVLRIIAIDLEETTDCVADYIAVYSGYALDTTKNAELKERLCFMNATMTRVTTTNVMTVKFVSDSYYNETGFNAYVFKECGGELKGPNGVIDKDNKTLSIRGFRNRRLSCEWTVTVRTGKTIKVTITELSILGGPNNTCVDNYIILKNGADASSPLLGAGKYCGEIAPAPLQTTGNRLYVKVSGIISRINFKLLYREEGINCGGDYVLTSADNQLEINSPNYPNIPSPFTECTWKIMAPGGERITINFLDRFDLTNSPNCEREYIEIRDGGTDNSKEMGRFCKDVAPNTMSTTGNMMYIYFYTDLPEPKNGFKAAIVSGDVCGGVLRGTKGFVQSPNYPHPYPKNLSCSWTIIGPIDHTLKIEFRDIQLPNGLFRETSDYVAIGEKTPGNDTAMEITKYHGNEKPDLIETSSNEAVIYFNSDERDYIQYRGFNLNYTASQEACGGDLTALNGIIKSPGYPNPKRFVRYCDWRIKLPIGFQVVVNILDIDISNDSGFGQNRVAYSLPFYNDFRFLSRIKTLGWNTNVRQIESSSNTMMIGYWSSGGHRGFKLQYSAAVPAPCGATVNDLRGTLTGPTSAPFNESTYFCKWILAPPNSLLTNGNTTGLTLSVKVSGTIGTAMARETTRQCYLHKYISITGIGMICGNLTKPMYLRSPLLENELTILNGTYGRQMRFNLTYEWQACGGILNGPSHTISSPKSISYPINCVWHAKYPSTEDTIKLTFSRLNLGSCENGYIIIRNGGPSSPKIGMFCGNLMPHNITSTSNQLWLEYFAASDPNDFELNLELASSGCGGTLRGASRQISSPSFPKRYPNNAECTWEIMAESSYHIDLIFVDRFNLESSANCEKDYVQIFDWTPEYKTGGGKWKEIGKVCGRTAPAPFNSTTNRMKVVFRSNEAVQGDGFRAIWNKNCGGIFEVSEEPRFILSPMYPNFYPPQANCNYSLVAPGEDIIVEFVDFELEPSRLDCIYDNVTVVTQDLDGNEMEETWCGNNKPSIIRSTSRADVIFKSDNFNQRTGFKFKFFTNKCGGIITEPSELKPLMHWNEYLGHINCTWIIKAPEQKSVVLRFEKFILEYSLSCYYDHVIVYEGTNMDSDKIMGKVCGNLTEHLPIFKSESNNMIVTFISDDSRHYEGFTAMVLFGSSSATGCGGTINLTKTESHSFKTQNGLTYDPLEDCHWHVITTPGKNIRFSITFMDIRNSNISSTVNKDRKCTGDYLQIHDGSGPFAEILGTYCGSEPPKSLISSSNVLWIRFFSDGTNEGLGVRASVDAVDSLCGLNVRLVNASKEILTSPGYPNPYQPGIRCRWILRHPNRQRDTIQIRLLDFNMTSSKDCEEEYLQIFDRENRQYIDHGYGESLIYSGTKHYPVPIEVANRRPFSMYKFCGDDLPFDFISYSNEIEIKFKTTSHGKGFKLEYNEAACNRNYTSDQGRVIHQGFSDCWVTITAKPNHTISLYFNYFRLYDNKMCTKNALQVRDGDFSGNLLATLCGVETPSPIFSTSNKLSLHSWSERSISYESYDITYVTTTQGRGCGGVLFNYGGTFTSPLYPNMYRNNTVCRWDVSVPRGFKVVLQFSVFDIGVKENCQNNNVKIYDASTDGEAILRNTYCGGDDPATLEVEGYRVFVDYTSTVNNIGTGWVISFVAQPTSHSTTTVI